MIADGVKLVTTTTGTSSGVYYVHNNHLGTPQTLTDNNQDIVWAAEYDPFGRATVTMETVTNNVRFPGQYFDQETGLHYNYFRTYDPGTGRYITSDPIGLGGGINTYGYVDGNPIVFYDIFGLVNQSRERRGRNRRNTSTGRAGVFGCLVGCASFTQGDTEAQVSISSTLGGGFMMCSPKPEEKCEDKEAKPPQKDCGIFDPNCDDNTQPGASAGRFGGSRGGAALGFITNDDGSFCILIGPFVSYPVISPTFNLGGFSE